MRGGKHYLREFDQLEREIISSATPEIGEAIHVRRERVQHLLNNWPEFMKYYFPNWAKSEFAPFHIRGGNAVMNWKKKKLFFGWPVARNLSKTTFWQMFSMYLNCRAIAGQNLSPSGGGKGEAKWSTLRTGLFMSKTYDQAAKQLTAMRKQFEFNRRLINDFGEFKTVNQWGDEFFKTTQGISWIPIGKGQSPRGLKDEDLRVNLHVWDDFDDDEECRNDERLDKSWKWITSALIPTLDVGDEALVAGLNNLIHPKSLMSRALGRVENIEGIFDWYEVVNLMNDKQTIPSWPARHTVEDCKTMIDKTGRLASQAEYFNNPVIEGKVFKADYIQFKPMNDMRKYAALVAYLDPSFSAKKNADHKSWVLMGLTDGEIHVIKVFCDVATIEEMVQWGYEIVEYCKNHNGAPELFIEEVFFQSILYKDFTAAAKRKGWPLPLQGDTRKKPDKDQRIMACAGHFERGEWYFNEAEKDNRHMKNLIFQYTAFAPGHTGIKKDGPDACEGGKEKLFERVQTAAPATAGRRATSKNRY
jgi:hypothetical protein